MYFLIIQILRSLVHKPSYQSQMQTSPLLRKDHISHIHPIFVV